MSYDDMMRSAARNAALHGEVETMLRDLGSNPDEIAGRIADEEITGTIREPATCPVALWLKGALDEDDLTVRVDSREVLVEGESTRFHLPAPPAVSRFVELFDSGAYPELERREKVMHLGGIGDFYAPAGNDDDEEEDL